MIIAGSSSPWLHRSRPPIPLLLLIAAALVAGPRMVAAQGYARDAGTVVASLTEVLGEVGDADAGPSVKVHGDGRADVHYPRYMKRAGDYVVQLSPNELDALVASLVDDGLLDLDPQAVRSAQRQTLRLSAAPVLVVTADAPTTIIEIRTGRGARRIVWNGLREDARQYPNVSALQNLAAAEQRLRAVMERPDAQRVR
jgi:hypothetical protein